MDLRDSPDEASFRARLRAWLHEHVAGALNDPAAGAQPSTVASRFARQHAWHAELYRGGWLGLDWPARYGGAGLTVLHQLILNEELDAAGAPPIANWVGLELVGPTVLRWGDERQKQRYLPGILDGSDVWCQGFSEPEAGSDLAAVATSAERAPGGFRLTGHKRWTSWAQLSDHALVLARTGRAEARHRTLTCFIVPLSTPGVLVEPIPMLYGDAEESDVLLDQVFVPGDAVLGPVDGGWGVVMHSLTLARGPATLARISALEGSFRRLAADLCEEFKAPSADQVPAAGSARVGELHDAMLLAELAAQLQALRFLAYRKVGELAEDGAPGPVASVEKLLWAGLNTRVTDLAVQRAGIDALASPGGALAQDTQRAFYRALAGEIEGGTNEIQRTIIARHILGLPC